MLQETKVFIAIGIITLAIIGGGVFLLTKQIQSQPGPGQAVKDNLVLVSDDARTLGPKDAKVTIVAFSDFQCPACAAAYPIAKQIVASYQDKVFFVFRHFPIPAHRNAKVAAYAAEAAGEQGKFWEMHDKLFDTQNEWSTSANPEEKFSEYAKSLNLDLEKFKNDMNNDNLKKRIEKGISDGRKAQVNATPTFFINGEKQEGVESYQAFQQKIESLLSKNQ